MRIWPFRRSETVPRERYDDAVARAAAAETRANGLTKTNRDLAARNARLVAQAVQAASSATQLVDSVRDAMQMQLDRRDRKLEVLLRELDKFRGVAAELNEDITQARADYRELAVRLEDTAHELALARKHLDGCAIAQQVADHDTDKRNHDAGVQL